MDEEIDSRFHYSIQNPENRGSNRSSYGNYGKTAFLSSGSNGNNMGRGVSVMDVLHYGNDQFRGNGASRPKKISFQNANYLSRQNYNDGDKCERSPNSSKCNNISEKNEDRKIYVRGVSSQWSRKEVVREQRINSNVKGENYADTTMVPFECCPNQERIRSLQLSLGQLRRIGVLAGNAWTKEKPKTPCRLVVPNVQSVKTTIPETMSHVQNGEKQYESREDCNNPKNPFMIVEMIANQLDRKRVAKSLNCNFEGGDPSTFIFYMTPVKEYGFDHIILIGEQYAGILFLDCYGRVFEWGSMCNVLRVIGDFWSEVKKESRTTRIFWGLEFDGTIDEYEDVKNDSPNEITFDKSINKKMNSKKKKSSKKKQH